MGRVVTLPTHEDAQRNQMVDARVYWSVQTSDADPLAGDRRHFCYSESEFSVLYLRMPKSAPQSWLTFTVPSTGPGPFEEPVMLVTSSCGRGLSVGKLLFG
jgi:hypothetical protein